MFLFSTCPQQVLLLSDDFHIREELMDCPLHPAVQSGREQGAIQAGAPQSHLQLFAVVGYKFHGASMELFDVRADLVDQAAQLRFSIS